MPILRIATAGYFWFKAAVFALLALNTAAYLASGTPSEALDSLAWLALLVSFELETRFAGRFREGRMNTAIRVVRMAAAAALVIALMGYVRSGEWLDTVNVGLWIGVVALLEFEVRRPDDVTRHRKGFVAATSALYAGLVGLVLAWLLRGEWFDAYDAVLWLVAFATLEMGLLGHFRNDRAAT